MNDMQYSPGAQKGRARTTSSALHWLPAALVLVGFMSGCSMLERRAPEEIVAERAQQRVELLMQSDHKASYQYTTPGYRSLETPGQYGTRWSGVTMWRSAQVRSVRCFEESADKCRVALTVRYKAFGHDEIDAILNEEWVQVDGKWYLYQDLRKGL